MAIPLVVVSFARVASAQTWSLDDALDAAHAAAPLNELLAARIEARSAELEASFVRPTPTLGLGHEALFGNSTDSETTISLHHPFDVSGWREDLREALPHEHAALAEEAQAARIALETEVKTAFFEVRLHEERIAAVDAWMARLEGGVAAAAAREEAGDASEYDVRRVERELEIAAAERAREVSRLAEAWAALGALAPHQERPVLSGALRPEAPRNPQLGNLPALGRLDAMVAAREAEADAWGSPGLRDWEIGAGYRLANGPGATAHGFIVELSIPLPTRNTDAARIDALVAQADALRAERLVIETLATNTFRAARARLEGVLDALTQMPTSSSEGELTRMAELAYSAGEASLTDLLDAYGSEAELQLARIDLEWEARRAAIEWELREGQRREQ